MNLGISNIAFKEDSFLEMLRILKSSEIKGLEIAPTLLWDDPLSASKEKRKAVKEILSEHGLTVIGLHSLLFKQPDLQLFDSLKRRECCKEYIKHMIGICSDLDGMLIAFGAPNNRKRGDLTHDEALSIAASFFYELSECAMGAGVCVCIEPLSSQYGCDFITTADEGAQIVKMVNHPNFRLLLDTGSMSLNREPCHDMIVKYADIIAHMHINDPHLSPPGAKNIDHLSIAKSLENICYKMWLTLEFIAGNSTIERDISYAMKCYSH